MATPQPIPAPSATHPNAARDFVPPGSSPQSHRNSFSYAGGSGSLPRRVSPPLLSPILGRSNFGLAPAGSAQARRPGPVPITSATSPNAPAYSWAGGTSRGSSMSSESDVSPATPKDPFSAPLASDGGLATSPISGAPLGRVPSFPLGSGLPSEGVGRGWASQRISTHSPEREHKAMGILRRFSMGQSAKPAPISTASPISPISPTRPAEPASASMAGHGRSVSVASGASNTSAAGSLDVPLHAVSGEMSPPVTERRGSRGRRASGSIDANGNAIAGSAIKRKPSPMGERLLMGHFNAH